MLTDERLAAIAARAEAATPGPWELLYSAAYRDYGLRSMTGRNICGMDFFEPGADNATFIAHAREDVPVLLAEASTLRRQLAEITTALGLAPSDDWLEVAGAAGNLVVQLEIAADELTDLRRQLAECQEAMRNMRRDEYARVSEEYPTGRTLIIPPDVNGSMTIQDERG